jgi:hypothetical protein
MVRVPGSGGQSNPDAPRGGQTMSFDHVIGLVARQHDLPVWLAQGIAADVALSEAIGSSRTPALLEP